MDAFTEIVCENAHGRTVLTPLPGGSVGVDTSGPPTSPAPGALRHSNARVVMDLHDAIELVLERYGADEALRAMLRLTRKRKRLAKARKAGSV